MIPTTTVTGMAMLRLLKSKSDEKKQVSFDLGGFEFEEEVDLHHDFAVFRTDPVVHFPSLHLPPNPQEVPSTKVDWRTWEGGEEVSVASKP